MTFALLPGIPSIYVYETAKVCSTESKPMKSISSDDCITAKASLKVKYMSDHITALVCKRSLFAAAEI